MTDRTLVVVPTYDERANLAPLLERIHTSVGGAHVLIVDDNSPDGTGQLAQRLVADRPWLHVLHRPGKQGLGVAYIAGYGWGLAHGYDVFVQLDADLSHLPEQIPDLLAALDADEGADLVIGTRWMPGGWVENWSRRREWLSRGGNLYTQTLLGLPLRDVTGGFRAWRRHTLEGVDLAGVASAGYCFQVDLARRAVAGGFAVREVPIRFVERTWGTSKMNAAVVCESLWRISAWGARHQMMRLRDVLLRHPDGRSR